MRDFALIVSCKSSVDVTVEALKTEFVRLENDAFVLSFVEVATYAFYSVFVCLFGVELESSTLVYGILDVWTSIACKLREHTNGRAIVPRLFAWGSVFVSMEWR